MAINSKNPSFIYNQPLKFLKKVPRNVPRMIPAFCEFQNPLVVIIIVLTS